jgi:general secretion pathway protein B
MSFILDALRKSEHERQRSTVPGLAQVPLAIPRTELPRWALIVIGLLAAAVLVLGGAWWQSQRGAAPAATAVATPSAAPAPIERPLAVPRPAPSFAPAATPPAALPTVTARSEPPPSPAQSLAQAAAPLATPPPALGAAEPLPASRAAATANASAANSAETTLPSAAALAAQGILLPQLRLELHAYAERPADRFVFINGRKYTEGQRLSEGPEIIAIAPNGAVLGHLGHRFLLSPE